MAKKIKASDYWRRRETRQRNKNIKDQKEYDKHIKSIYQKAMDNIQKEIDSFYARYAKKEGITLAEAKKRASKLDMEEYSRKAKRYVDEKDFSKEANEEMRLYNMTMKANRLELLKANIGLELADGFNDLQKYFDQKLTDRTMDEFKRQAGILGDTVTDTDAAKRARALVNASFHNARWSDRIWMHQDLLKNKLDSLLRTGLIQGRNSRELARDLRKSFDVSINDSERLMRTEMARVQTAAQQESFERNGFTEYEYICCGLPDACEICRELDGKIFKVKDMMPGENAPPMHPNCHCSTAAAAANREDFDAWLDAKAAGETGLGFEEWRGFNNSANSGKPLVKSISLDDFEVLKRLVGDTAKDPKYHIADDIMNAISKSLKDQGGLSKFDTIKITALEKNKVFDTVLLQKGTFYSPQLVINGSFFDKLSLEEAQRIIGLSKNTVCETLEDCITHEIIHAKSSEKANISVVDRYDKEIGLPEISKTAAKDMLEALAEAGVLRKKNMYDTISIDAREKLEEAAKELGLW